MQETDYQTLADRGLKGCDYEHIADLDVLSSEYVDEAKVTETSLQSNVQNIGRHRRWLPKTNGCKAVKGHINTSENKGLAVTLNKYHLHHNTSVNRAFNE
ncbi:hypothetical protein DPMN_063889 [Dreissena polymorpha]|uniref:Uncharacterized protein n=1 Tax=Dreissena polymorpha TaxID=45954 RepID=A0A9D4HJK9_DREPO|nr:hypothetical protein DPMN_063889 [Dreissena polymorpha]